MMAIDKAPYMHIEEDYIDMEIIPPPQSREFEFQMTSLPKGRVPTTSPADELFYKGKLLPLHLPPRLQMVQTLAQISTTTNYQKPESIEIEPWFDISPSESCRTSCELNATDNHFAFSTEMKSFIQENSKQTWSKKLKQIKQSSLGQKLKASRAYIKSLFNKSACSNDSCAKAAFDVGNERLNKYIKVANKTPFGKKTEYNRRNISGQHFNRNFEGDGVSIHRRSFSGVIQRASTSKISSLSNSSSGSSSLSSSFSFSSNGLYDLELFNRSGSSTSERECSIEEAIAHCKQSQVQQLFDSRKIADETGDCLMRGLRV